MVKTYFFDTSALVKRYITEIGSQRVRALVDPQAGNKIILARITWVETRTSVAVKHLEAAVVRNHL